MLIRDQLLLLLLSKAHTKELLFMPHNIIRHRELSTDPRSSIQHEQLSDSNEHLWTHLRNAKNNPFYGGKTHFDQETRSGYCAESSKNSRRNVAQIPSSTHPKIAITGSQFRTEHGICQMCNNRQSYAKEQIPLTASSSYPKKHTTTGNKSNVTQEPRRNQIIEIQAARNK